MLLLLSAITTQVFLRYSMAKKAYHATCRTSRGLTLRESQFCYKSQNQDDENKSMVSLFTFPNYDIYRINQTY